jgi:hypothetical protein
MTTLKNILRRSIFRKVPSDATMNDLLAILFHRTAATMYAIYALWAIVSIIGGLPSITHGLGDLGQITFSSLVLITSAPACFGAVFWPNMARMELVFGSGFTMTIIIYLYFLISRLIAAGGSWAGFILVFSILVMPVARTSVVIIFLLRQAESRKRIDEAP